jgi:hypothetical protein
MECHRKDCNNYNYNQYFDQGEAVLSVDRPQGMVADFTKGCHCRQDAPEAGGMSMEETEIRSGRRGWRESGPC